jgi:DNA adenine methylase
MHGAQALISDARTELEDSRIRPPLKWAGGKRWQLEHLGKWWRPNRHRRLVEPFAGGLAVALGLRPARALLNDVNPHLINFYRWLKRGLTPQIRPEHSARYYYRARKRFNALLQKDADETAEAAHLFWYLNRTGYNGLCRFNRKGEFNVPFGRYRSLGYEFDFSLYKEIFRDWEFTNVHFSELQLDENDFVYADPPYDVDFTNYSQGGFNWEDQKKTAGWLARHPGPVVLSNQATRRILDLYCEHGFTVREIDAPRRISCTGDRRPAKEVLAFRNLPE